MEEIKVMVKPDWISWDSIHELLVEAHKKNIKKGMTMRVPQLSPEELKQKMGENSRCFVAMADNILVGTTSVRFFKGRSWYDRSQVVAHSMMSAILPKYQGLGITDDLNAMRDNYICEMGAQMIHADTAENNIIVRKNAKRNGFIDVAYYAPKSDHYSVIFVKWLQECPFSDSYIRRKYKMSKVLTIMEFKKGKVRRSYILSLFCRAVRKLFDV